jgi:hypothetical protein
MESYSPAPIALRDYPVLIELSLALLTEPWFMEMSSMNRGPSSLPGQANPYKTSPRLRVSFRKAADSKRRSLTPAESDSLGRKPPRPNEAIRQVIVIASEI